MPQSPLLTPEVVALILSAFFGAITAQFLSFYRQRRQRFEEMKNILFLISSLDGQEIEAKTRKPTSFIWSLRDDLFESHKKNTLYLGERSELVMDVIREFPNERKRPEDNVNGDMLQMTAKTTYIALNDIKPRQIFWQSILAFLGFSQIEYADTLDNFLKETGLVLDTKDSSDKLIGFYIKFSHLVIGVVFPMLALAALTTGILSSQKGVLSLQPEQYVTIIASITALLPLFVVLLVIMVAKPTADNPTSDEK